MEVYHVCLAKDANSRVKVNLFIRTKKKNKTQSHCSVKKADNSTELLFFSSFQKRLFIHFECSNMRELFGIARMQTNLNSLKEQVSHKVTVNDMLHVSFCCKNGRIKKETELNPQLSFSHVLNKCYVFALCAH